MDYKDSSSKIGMEMSRVEQMRSAILAGLDNLAQAQANDSENRKVAGCVYRYSLYCARNDR
jgi:hypothetical protein